MGAEANPLTCSSSGMNGTACILRLPHRPDSHIGAHPAGSSAIRRRKSLLDLRYLSGAVPTAIQPFA
jgi:hypothetical protein